jgi:hypothetical protein
MARFQRALLLQAGNQEMWATEAVDLSPRPLEMLLLGMASRASLRTYVILLCNFR